MDGAGFHLLFDILMTGEAKPPRFIQKKPLERRSMRLMAGRALTGGYRRMNADGRGRRRDGFMTPAADLSQAALHQSGNIGGMRLMTGITGPFRERGMHNLAFRGFRRRLVAGQAQFIAIGLQERRLPGGVGFVALIALAGLQRHMDILVRQPAIDIIVAPAAKIKPVGDGQMIVGGTMRDVAIKAGTIGKRGMDVGQRQSFFFGGMAVGAEGIQILGDQLGLHLSMPAVAQETIFLGGFMDGAQPQLSGNLIVALNTKLARWFGQQVGLGRTMGGMTAQALAGRHRGVPIIPAHCRRVVAGQAERTPLALDGEGMGIAGGIVAAFAFSALDRGMDRGSQEPGGVGGMDGMADGALTFRHGIASMGLDKRLGGGIMAIPAQLFFLFDQQMLLVAAVNRMTGETPLLQRFMLMCPRERLSVMATVTGFRGRSGEHSGGVAGMRIMAGGAAALPRRVMQMGLIQAEGGFVMAKIAERRSLVFQAQHADYAVRLMA